MSPKQLLEDPTNRIVSVFDGQEQAEAARKELSEAGLDDDQIRVAHGSDPRRLGRDMQGIGPPN